MKIARYKGRGRIRPAILDTMGGLRDVSDLVRDIDFSALPDLVERLTNAQPEMLPIVPASWRLSPPITSVSKFIGIGLNYRDHALESGMPIPAEPVIFMKATSSISGSQDDIILPPRSTKTDWEVELGIVIGERASHIGEDRALEHIAGYTIVHDVSEREYQNERGGTWDKGKGCDSFGPIGPWLVTRDEVADPQALDLWLDLNGEPMQRGSTANMIFSCAELVAYVSRFMTLMPGDIITTGTPAGVGLGRTPPVYLKPGDVVTLGITGLGEQRQTVRAFDEFVVAAQPHML